MLCAVGWRLGAFQLNQRRKLRASGRGKFIPLFPILPSSLHPLIDTESSFFSLAFHLDFFPLFFQGLWSLQQASQLWKEAWKLKERTHQLETEGWRQMREVVAASEAEGLYGLLKGVVLYSHPVPSQPPIKKPCLASSTTISQPPLQESTGPEASDPVGQATLSTSPAATPAPEKDIPAHMQPLRIQVGGTKRVYQCQLEGCKEGPSTSWATICAHMRKVHLGVRLVCSLCGKTFFNLDVLRHHKKLISKLLGEFYKQVRGGGKP